MNNNKSVATMLKSTVQRNSKCHNIDTIMKMGVFLNILYTSIVLLCNSQQKLKPQMQLYHPPPPPSFPPNPLKVNTKADPVILVQNVTIVS